MTISVSVSLVPISQGPAATPGVHGDPGHPGVHCDRAAFSGGDLVLGTLPPHPALTALLEADGALLLWDLRETGEAPRLPAAIVWDRARARAWAWEIYGRAATAALAGTDSEAPAAPVFAAEAGPSLAPAYAAARTAWAAAWWPASNLAGIPPLDPRLLALERASALTDIEHLLDAPETVDAAIEHALCAAGAVTVDAAATEGSEAATLQQRVGEIADDRGISVARDLGGADALASYAQDDVALAASASDRPAGARALASGSAPINLAAFAPGSVDAAAAAAWRIDREGGGNRLSVAIARAPRHPAAARAPQEPRHAAPQDAAIDAVIAATPAAVPGVDLLTARFCGVDLALAPHGDEYRGSIEVPAAILLTRPEERTLTVASPGYAARASNDTASGDLADGADRADRVAPADPVPAVDAAALIAVADAALAAAAVAAAATSTTAAEREAALRGW